MAAQLHQNFLKGEQHEGENNHYQHDDFGLLGFTFDDVDNIDCSRLYPINSTYMLAIT